MNKLKTKVRPNNSDLNLESLKMVAHDMRNPVISIRAFSQLILENSQNLETENKEFLEIINEVSKNLLDMTEKLLEQTDFPQKKSKSEKKQVDLTKLVQERVKLYKPQADKKEIKIFESCSNIPLAYIDKDNIARVIDNLLSNAIKYSFIKSNIFINIEQINNQIIFSIKDGGDGILLKEQHKLFKKYERLSNKPTQGERSHGLGLAIAKQIIKDNSGTIEYKNTEESGSVFILRLPITFN